MKSQGYATLTDRMTGKITGECDTHQCCHCGAVIHAPANKKIEEVADFAQQVAFVTSDLAIRENQPPHDFGEEGFLAEVVAVANQRSELVEV